MGAYTRWGHYVVGGGGRGRDDDVSTNCGDEVGVTSETLRPG